MSVSTPSPGDISSARMENMRTMWLRIRPLNRKGSS